MDFENESFTTINSMKPHNDGKIHNMFIPTYFGGIFCLSWLAGKIVNTTPLVFIGLYFVYLFILHIWHYQAHHDIWWVPFNKACRKYHTEHHWKTFPPDKFYGNKKAEDLKKRYENDYWYLLTSSLPAQSSLEHEGLIYLLFVVLLLIETYVIKFKTSIIVMGIIEAIVFGTIGNYLHMSYHIENHWLGKYHWYQVLRWNHYCHHLGTAKHNYAIAFFMLDELFNTTYVPVDKSD